jgi:hypothetical protein
MIDRRAFISGITVGLLAAPLAELPRIGDPGAFCPRRPATSDHQGRRPYRLSVYRALPSRGTFPHSSAASGGGCDASTTFSYFLFNLTSY